MGRCSASGAVLVHKWCGGRVNSKSPCSVDPTAFHPHMQREVVRDILRWKRRGMCCVSGQSL